VTPFQYHAITNHHTAVVVLAIEIVLFSYFLLVNGFYVATAIVALFRLPGFVQQHLAEPVRRSYSQDEYPVSVLVPAYNEGSGVVKTIMSLLQLDYALYEIIVINDGSTDSTLDRLKEHFALQRFPEATCLTFKTQPVRATYCSAQYPALRVVDKENGGKADALNAGINSARYPLIFACDGDSYYSPDALLCLTEPYLQDPNTVVSGGGIGVSNDCVFEDGKLADVRLSKNWIVRFQVLEYLRAFLSSRLGWARVNALAIISGACGLWRKDVITEAGGYRTDTVWEDMEMTLRVHHMLRKRRQPYRVAFTPFIVCWTEVPRTVREIWRQRVSWHRHVSECMTIHRRMLFGRWTGSVGWISFPYFVLCEWLAPLMVVLGFAFGFVAAYFGFLSYTLQYILLGLVFTLSLAVSAAAILLDELSFNTYSPRDLFALFVSAFLEQIGYRQLVTLANLGGLAMWVNRAPIRGKRSVPSWNVPAYDPLERRQ